MYTDYYLKFTDEAEARAVLYRKEGVVEADPENGIEAQEGYEVSNFANIDHIGTIWKPTGRVETRYRYEAPGNYEEIIEHIEQVPEMAPLPGYHVNVRVVGEDASALEAYKVGPKQPVRGWA